MGGTMCSSNRKAIVGSFDLRKRGHTRFLCLFRPLLPLTAPCPVLFLYEHDNALAVAVAVADTIISEQIYYQEVFAHCAQIIMAGRVTRKK